MSEPSLLLCPKGLWEAKEKPRAIKEPGALRSPPLTSAGSKCLLGSQHQTLQKEHTAVAPETALPGQREHWHRLMHTAARSIAPAAQPTRVLQGTSQERLLWWRASPDALVPVCWGGDSLGRG